jgi:hypothetical protein
MKNLLYVVIICTLPLLVGCEPNNNPDKPSNNSNFSSKGFTVNEYGKKVVFSQGNLQYHPKNNLWRFAEKQTDYISDTIISDYLAKESQNLSTSYDGWIDLFGWGTGANPTHTSLEDFVDWGRNKIGNDAAGTWYTLSRGEWYYVTSGRANAPFLIGVAQVDGVNGLILLPDNWECPKDIIFRSGFYNDYANFQTYTAEQWYKMEHAGAVFLPVGIEDGSAVGFYWSSSRETIHEGPAFQFNSYDIWFDDLNYRIESYRGRVRLVREL